MAAWLGERDVTDGWPLGIGQNVALHDFVLVFRARLLFDRAHHLLQAIALHHQKLEERKKHG